MSDELCAKLGYQFKEVNLLKMALTHRSASEINSERLEFLGDSVVNFVVAEALYQQFPKAQEGELSRWRATLINRETLCQLARDFDVGRYLILGSGEQKSGGHQRSSILSCTMEAIIGAIYLDAGFAAIRDCILRWYAPLLAQLGEASSLKDPKTALQEILQSYRMPLPVYKVERVTGEAHQQLFSVSCTVEGVTEKILGQGTSRRRAEQEAAANMLGKIKK